MSSSEGAFVYVVVHEVVPCVPPVRGAIDGYDADAEAVEEGDEAVWPLVWARE